VVLLVLEPRGGFRGDAEFTRRLPVFRRNLDQTPSRQTAAESYA